MHDHAFDPVSGWCLHCGLRDDNRLVDLRTGIEYRPGAEPTPEQIQTVTDRKYYS